MLTNTKGQVLTELLVAVSVVVIGVLALVQLATKSLTNSGFSRRQSEATSYGASANDWLRSQRNVLGWDVFGAKSGQTYCINNLDWTPGACGTSLISGTTYSREVTLVTLTPGEKIEADVVIKWQESGKSFSSKQATIFGRYAQSSLSQAAPTPTPTPTPFPTPTPTPTPAPNPSWIVVGNYNVSCNSTVNVSYLARQMRFTMTSGGGHDCVISFGPAYGSLGVAWTTSDNSLYRYNSPAALRCGDTVSSVDFGLIKTVIRQRFSVGCNDGESMNAQVSRYGY